MEFLNLELLNFGILLGAICTLIAGFIGMGVNYCFRLINNF